MMEASFLGEAYLPPSQHPMGYKMSFRHSLLWCGGWKKEIHISRVAGFHFRWFGHTNILKSVVQYCVQKRKFKCNMPFNVKYL